MLHRFFFVVHHYQFLHSIYCFADKCTLKETEKVEKMQWNLVRCLRCLLKRNYAKPDERLWQIFDKLTSLRTFSHFGNEINQMRAKWPVMKDHPLVLEMIKPDANETQ
jgi:hypothetical protein